MSQRYEPRVGRAPAFRSASSSRHTAWAAQRPGAALPLMAAALLIAAAGCRGKPATRIDESAYVGTWVESFDALDVRRPAPERHGSALREITLNADHSFKLRPVNQDGSPAGSGVIEGTWSMEADSVVFNVQKNTLDEKHKPWVPVRIDGVTSRATGVYIDVAHGDEELVQYKKK
jgi:hypothetical protein